MKKLICTAEIRSVISDIDAKKGRAGADLICLGFLYNENPQFNWGFKKLKAMGRKK